MRKIILSAILTAFTAIVLISGTEFTTTSAQSKKTVDVKYSPIGAGKYSLDTAHGIIGFSVRHLEINWVEGRFKDFKGTVNYDDKDVTKSTVEFSAKIESVDTGIAPRDAHLKSADFFDAANSPEMKFVSTKIVKKGKNLTIFGDFTLKGVTKEISFPFTVNGGIKDPWGNDRFGIEAHTKINRRDYGINYGKAMEIGGFDIGNEVTVNLLLEAVKPNEKK
jgi:polyisoprenoid-binding protein YceI